MPRDEPIRQLIERFDERLARNDEVMEFNRQAFERNTRAWGHTVAAMTAIRDSIEEMRLDIRANTKAILHVLDRLEGGQQA